MRNRLLGCRRTCPPLSTRCSDSVGPNIGHSSNRGTEDLNPERIETATRMALEAIGEDPDREGLAGTPRRVAEMYSELFSGLGKDPAAELTISFDEGHQEMVIVRDIPFYS
ncbi:MAG: GTP cyclohydrolase I, partial [Chloroflexi bacterium]|nr:GTP cyclohydrolase I [Chloroflexota bacterium]